MAKRKSNTRGKSARTRAAAKEARPVFPVAILDKADDLKNGIKALENAAEGAFVDRDGTTAINWMLDHLEREHGELVAMLETFHAAYKGGANV